MSSQLRIEIPKGVHPDLQEERKTPSFNVEKLADKLNGGPAARRKRKEIGKFLHRTIFCKKGSVVKQYAFAFEFELAPLLGLTSVREILYPKLTTVTGIWCLVSHLCG